MGRQVDSAGQLGDQRGAEFFVCADLGPESAAQSAGAAYFDAGGVAGTSALCSATPAVGLNWSADREVEVRLSLIWCADCSIEVLRSAPDDTLREGRLVRETVPAGSVR